MFSRFAEEEPVGAWNKPAFLVLLYIQTRFLLFGRKLRKERIKKGEFHFKEFSDKELRNALPPSRFLFYCFECDGFGCEPLCGL